MHGTKNVTTDNSQLHAHILCEDCAIRITHTAPHHCVDYIFTKQLPIWNDEALFSAYMRCEDSWKVGASLSWNIYNTSAADGRRRKPFIHAACHEHGKSQDKFQQNFNTHDNDIFPCPGVSRKNDSIQVSVVDLKCVFMLTMQWNRTLFSSFVASMMTTTECTNSIIHACIAVVQSEKLAGTFYTF